MKVKGTISVPKLFSNVQYHWIKANHVYIQGKNITWRGHNDYSVGLDFKYQNKTWKAYINVWNVNRSVTMAANRNIIKFIAEVWTEFAKNNFELQKTSEINYLTKKLKKQNTEIKDAVNTLTQLKNKQKEILSQLKIIIGTKSGFEFPTYYEDED